MSIHENIAMTVPTINTVNLPMVNSEYMNKTRTTSLSNTELAVIRTVLSTAGTMPTNTVLISKSSRKITRARTANIGTMPANSMRCLVSGNETFIFGGSCMTTTCDGSTCRVEAGRRSVNIIFDAHPEDFKYGDGEIHITVMHASAPIYLSRTRALARGISETSYRAASVISLVRNKVSTLLTEGCRKDGDPIAVRMILEGPIVGRPAIDALILIKAFILIGGRVRFCLIGDSDLPYVVDSVNYIGVEYMDPDDLAEMVDAKAPDHIRHYALMSKGRMVESVEMITQ